MKPYISKTMSKNHKASGYIDVVAPNRKAAEKFMRGKGLFKETLHRAYRHSKGLAWGTYTFYRRRN